LKALLIKECTINLFSTWTRHKMTIKVWSNYPALCLSIFWKTYQAYRIFYYLHLWESITKSMAACLESYSCNVPFGNSKTHKRRRSINLGCLFPAINLRTTKQLIKNIFYLCIVITGGTIFTGFLYLIIGACKYLFNTSFFYVVNLCCYCFNDHLWNSRIL